MTREKRNWPARNSFRSAAIGASLVLAIFLTPMYWLLYGQTYTVGLTLSAVLAIPFGHAGR
ncbi:hypothetical protein ABTX35_02905 [Streptomyces sp. NPDC096080]|uniref:hypothetical protein n=1 Tax=Streptomyces sp. NPDC096080 TaxID=3156693 RepID=UPI003333DA8C